MRKVIDYIIHRLYAEYCEYHYSDGSEWDWFCTPVDRPTIDDEDAICNLYELTKSGEYRKVAETLKREHDIDVCDGLWKEAMRQDGW